MRIALLGMGTVGGGVYELAAKKGIEVVRVLERVRRTENATTDIADIADDPRIEAVAEMMGGVEPARTYIVEALEIGKQVVRFCRPSCGRGKATGLSARAGS